MKKLIFSLTLLILITSASANIEQHEGFPVYVVSGLQAQLVAKDIDGDGKLEIIASPENRMVKVFDHKGALKWENAGGRAQDDYGRVPVVSNLTGDSRLEIVSYGNPGWSDATFYIWDWAGIKLKEFWVGKYLIISSPALTKEGLILTGAAPGRAFVPILEGTGVHAFDTQGTKLWYLELGKSVNFHALIPVGDINKDGVDEAVILTQDINSAHPLDGKAWVIKATKTQGTILWSRDLGGDARGAAIGDLNGDGVNEVVAVSSSSVFIFDKNGVLLNNFKITGNRASPVIADIDGDGINEALVASRVDNKIYIISNGILKEFPAEEVSSNIAIGDLNNDGKLEIVAGNYNGKLYVWDYTGKLLDTVNAARKYQSFTSALIADLEGDGRKEIILGNSNGNIYVYTYGKKDITPPETTGNVDSAWHNTNVTITLEAKDEESGVAATYYTVDGSEPTKDSASGNTFTLSADGVYTIRYFSVDKAGNIEPVKTASNNVKIDKIPPSTTDNAGGQWHNGSAAVTLTANDGKSGVAATYYTVDGSEPSAGASVAISSEGIHTIKYYSVDKAGNVEQTREAVVRIDRTPPVAADDSDNRWHNTGVTLNITASDSLSGVAFMRYKSDGTELVSYSSNIRLAFTEEGAHEVEYYAVDNAGNAGNVKTALVKIDKTSPFTTDDSDGQWRNSSVLVTLKASDNLAGVQTTSYKVKSDTETVAGSFLAWLYNAIGLAEAASQGDAVYLQDEGVFSIQYRSMDNANNIETEKPSKQVKIDKTQPIIAGASTTLPNSNGWYNNDVTVH
ncbi:MAG: FG-GAP-like repeat-containing protein, partial [Candidatus Methanoperedens sp.]|nr:FG-GAP-like repeat-containing protein [Candidatus Methanoperedens sp.]